MKRFLQKFTHHYPGVSIVIATIFAAAMMLMTAQLAETTWKAGQMRRNWDLEGKAYYLGESVENIGKWLAGIYGVGMNSADDDLSKYPAVAWLYKTMKEYGEPDCAAKKCIGLEVRGRSAEPLLKMNSIPYYSAPLVYTDEYGKLQHTGDAAEGCEENFDPGFTADDPCHWNKIGLGEAVEIPLYYEDSTGEPIKPPLGSLLKVRVRAPLCKEEDKFRTPWCDIHGRIILYPSTYNTDPFADIENDKVLIQWLIRDVDDGSKVLLAKDTSTFPKKPYKRYPLMALDITKDEQNTEFSAGRINSANPFLGSLGINEDLTEFTVLNERQRGRDLNREDIFIKDFISDPNVKRPSLRLEMIGRPQKDDGTRSVYGRTKMDDKSLFVPYLEWQVLASKPISDSKSYYSGWVDLQGFGRKVSGVKKRPVTPQSFVLSQP